MARVFAALVRHGDYRQLEATPSAWQPFPLTRAGREQARHAAGDIEEQARLLQCRVHPHMDSSRLLRAWETASIMASCLGSEYQVREFDALAERTLGSAANLTIRQIEEVVVGDPRFDVLPPDWKSRSDFCLPLQGAESLIDAGQRVARHLRNRMQLLWREAGQDTLKVFVGHGAAIRHAAWDLGILKYGDIARLSMYHAAPVYLAYDGKYWKHIAGRWKQRERIEAPD